jgi:hypothetical protein
MWDQHCNHNGSFMHSQKSEPRQQGYVPTSSEEEMLTMLMLKVLRSYRQDLGEDLSDTASGSGSSIATTLSSTVSDCASTFFQRDFQWEARHQLPETGHQLPLPVGLQGQPRTQQCQPERHQQWKTRDQVPMGRCTRHEQPAPATVHDTPVEQDSCQEGRSKRFYNQFHKTSLCLYWVKNMCNKGDNCSYAHGRHQIRPMPDLSNTSLCSNLVEKGFCNDKACRYAHNLADLRTTDSFYKTQMCSLYAVGRCKMGAACRHAHSEAECRAAPEASEASLEESLQNTEENHLWSANSDFGVSNPTSEKLTPRQVADIILAQNLRRHMQSDLEADNYDTPSNPYAYEIYSD